jgi:hypothetical protein
VLHLLRCTGRHRAAERRSGEERVCAGAAHGQGLQPQRQLACPACTLRIIAAMSCLQQVVDAYAGFNAPR